MNCRSIGEPVIGSPKVVKTWPLIGPQFLGSVGHLLDGWILLVQNTPHQTLDGLDLVGVMMVPKPIGGLQMLWV